MSILVVKTPKLYVRVSLVDRGLYSEASIAYGTKMVGGVTPGKGGSG